MMTMAVSRYAGSCPLKTLIDVGILQRCSVPSRWIVVPASDATAAITARSHCCCASAVKLDECICPALANDWRPTGTPHRIGRARHWAHGAYCRALPEVGCYASPVILPDVERKRAAWIRPGEHSLAASLCGTCRECRRVGRTQHKCALWRTGRIEDVAVIRQINHHRHAIAARLGCDLLAEIGQRHSHSVSCISRDHEVRSSKATAGNSHSSVTERVWKAEQECATARGH